MDIQLRRGFFRAIENSAVGDNSGVDARGIKERKVVLQRGHILIFCKNVCRYVYLFVQRMGILYSRYKFVAVEIVGKRTERKIFTADIRRVRAEVKSRFKF